MTDDSIPLLQHALHSASAFTPERLMDAVRLERGLPNLQDSWEQSTTRARLTLNRNRARQLYKPLSTRTAGYTWSSLN
jgi:hypothetical protein